MITNSKNKPELTQPNSAWFIRDACNQPRWHGRSWKGGVRDLECSVSAGFPDDLHSGVLRVFRPEDALWSRPRAQEMHPPEPCIESSRALEKVSVGRWPGGPDVGAARRRARSGMSGGWPGGWPLAPLALRLLFTTSESLEVTLAAGRTHPRRRIQPSHRAPCQRIARQSHLAVAPLRPRRPMALPRCAQDFQVGR